MSPFYVEGDERGSLGKGIPQVGLFKESSKEGMNDPNLGSWLKRSMPLFYSP
jgi:hypothetical protein